MARLAIIKKPELIKAQWQKIKALRKELCDSPILLANGILFDADNDTVATMDESITYWSVQTKMKENNKIRWKAADNTICKYTKTEFTAIIAELKSKRAIRKDALFAYAEAKRDLLPLLDADAAFDKASWPT
jgi:hypothetical protein